MSSNTSSGGGATNTADNNSGNNTSPNKTKYTENQRADRAEVIKLSQTKLPSTPWSVGVGLPKSEEKSNVRIP